MKRFETTEPIVKGATYGTEYVCVRIKDNIFQTEADINLETNIKKGKINISIIGVDLSTVNQNDVISSLKDILRFALFGDNNKELNEERSVDKKTYWPKARYINSDGSISELFTDRGFDNKIEAEKWIYEWKKEFGFDICEAWIDVCGEKEYKNEYRSYRSEQNRIEVIRRYPQ